jgi:hypothetical protein
MSASEPNRGLARRLSFWIGIGMILAVPGLWRLRLEDSFVWSSAIRRLVQMHLVYPGLGALACIGLLLIVVRPRPFWTLVLTGVLGLALVPLVAMRLASYWSAVHPPWQAQGLSMVERLQRLRDHRALADVSLEKFRLLQRVPGLGRSHELQQQLARHHLREGNTRTAIEEYERLLSWGEQEGVGREVLAQYHALLATAYLRLAEQQNCVAHHGVDSCHLPIRGSGVHVDPEGSERAMVEFTRALQLHPEDQSSRWLLNLAAMTVGQHPAGIEAGYQITPQAFEAGAACDPFAERAMPLAVDLRSLAGGTILEDFDGDGLLDLMASGMGADEQLRYYHQNADGSFSEWTGRAGLMGQLGGLNLNHTDFDNDGDADVLVLRGAWLRRRGRQPNSLLRNEGDGTFTDVTEAAGLLSFSPTQTAVWVDYDVDGWLDLFIGNESTRGESHPCELFRNQGDGTFVNVARRVGVARRAFVKAVTAGDYDNDGLPDLYLSCQGEPNVLFHNEGASDGGWWFRDATAAAGVARPTFSFPTWFWDYDGDGWLDLFVAPYADLRSSDPALNDLAAPYLGQSLEFSESHCLYRNNGDGTFSEQSASDGLDSVLLVMGANYGDFDSDGWLDLYLGTGAPSFRALTPNRMFRGTPEGRFEDLTAASRTGHLQKGHGVAVGDFDSDGDQDLWVSMGGFFPSDSFANALYENPGHGHHWLTLRFHGVQSNRAGVGARVQVTVDDPGGPRHLHRLVGTGGSFGSSSLQAEIGLGGASRVQQLVVRWPSGVVQTFTDVAVDAVYLVREDAELLTRCSPASSAARGSDRPQPPVR